jgi:hypothetical protein
MPKLRTIIPVIIINGLLWGMLLYGLAGSVLALYERGYGRFSAILLYVVAPFVGLFVFALVPSLLCCLEKRDGARFLAWASVPCVVFYFLIVVGSAAI